jgi:hypothetical protein
LTVRLRSRENRSPKVIEFHTSSSEAETQITQKDLVEEAMLRRSKREIESALRQKRAKIKTMLEAGALVEDGVRDVELRQVKTRMVFK